MGDRSKGKEKQTKKAPKAGKGGLRPHEQREQQAGEKRVP